MWKFKCCPKCDGDLFVDWDMNGWYVQCLQCGYLSDLETALKAKNEAVKKEREKRLAQTEHPKAVAK